CRSIEGDTMNHEEDLLQQIVRIANISRAFFVEMKPRVHDGDVRAAFKYVSDVKNRFTLDLAPWAPACKVDDSYHVSVASRVERVYIGLKRSFDGARPQASAGLLDMGERELLRLVERLLEVAESPVLCSLLRAHYPALLVCREAMSRLREKIVA